MALERNKKINPGYFQQVLDISNGLSMQQRQFIQKVIDNVKKHNGAVTDKEYELLQRLKTGNFKYNTKNEVKNTSGNEILNKIIEKVYDTYSHALFMIHNSPIYPDDVYEMYMDTDPSNNLNKKWFDRNVIQNLERETKNPINHKTISDYVGKYIKNKAEKFNNRLK